MPGDKISPGATDWHPAGTIQPTSKQANFFAGVIKPGRVVRVSGRPLPLGEPVAELVAVKFDQEFGTTVPAKREVRRSDWLNFNVADAHVLHPVDWTVRKVPKPWLTRIIWSSISWAEKNLAKLLPSNCSS